MTEPTTPEPQLNRAGRRAESRRLRKTGAVMAAIPAAFGTTAMIVGATTSAVGAATTWTVNDNGDAGDGTCDVTCTLRDALDDAVDGDTIVFDATLTGDTINIDGNANGSLVVDYAVTIDATAAPGIAVDGNNAYRVFNINLTGAGTTVTITGLEITGGSTSGSGGAIYDTDADLTLIDAVLSGNTAGDDGGAIHGDNSDIDLTITNTTFRDNYARGYGGAIGFYDVGVVTITGSTFEDNTAYEGEGGAIYLYAATGPVTITGSTFTENRSIYDDGGAIRVDSGAPTEVTITDSTFTDNVAYYDGGAIAVDGIASLTITGSTFTGNTAEDGDGGAVYSDSGDDDPVVSISSSTFIDNISEDGDGGAVAIDGAASLTISASTFTGNSSNSDGGAVYVDDSDTVISISGSVFTDNTTYFDGGAIAIDSSMSFSMTTTTVSGNTALDTSGGGYGGGLYLGGVGTTAEITNSTVSGNTTNNDGGGIFVNYVGDGLLVANSTISGNTAAGTGGAMFLRASRIYEGPETYSYLVSDVQVVQTTITANVAASIGGIAFGPEQRESAAADGAGQPDAGDKKADRHDHSDKKHPEATEAAEGDDDATVRAAELTGDEVLTLDGTIVALNSGDAVGTEGYAGTVHATGSIFDAITGVTFVDEGGNQQGVNPLLGPLQDNGGPTQTHALLDGSPAINAGPDPVADFPGNADDQRGPGYPRVIGGRIDVGAFEAQPSNIEPTFTG